MKKILSVLLAICVLATFAFFAVGSSDDSSASVSQGEGAENSDSSSEAQTLTVNVGDTLTTDFLKITYSECVEYKDYNEFSAPESGNTVYRLKVDIENISDSDQFVSTWDYTCYADDNAADEYYYGDNSLSATISAGRKTSGYIYFEVPKDAENIEVEYETDFWSSKKAIFVVK